MQVDALAVRLRPRTPMEAADLGVRLCQSAARSVYPLLLRWSALPGRAARAGVVRDRRLAADAADLVREAMARSHDPLRAVARRVRAATTPRDLWRAQRQVWWSQLLFTLDLRRLSPWRSFTQPVYQLEGLSVWSGAARVFARSGSGRTGSALMMTQAFSLAEAALTLRARVAGVLVRAVGNGAGARRVLVRRTDSAAAR